MGAARLLHIIGLGATLLAGALACAAASGPIVPVGQGRAPREVGSASFLSRKDAPAEVRLAHAPVLPVSSQAALGITETTRAQLLAALARGDVSGAIAAYELHVGVKAPDWLSKLLSVYSAAGQKIGQCQDVARAIHAAFSKLGQQSEFIAIRTRGVNDYMTFDDVASGKALSVTRNGYHAAVRVGERVYDAFTGPAGMKLVDYLERLHAPEGIAWKVVSQP